MEIKLFDKRFIPGVKDSGGSVDRFIREFLYDEYSEENEYHLSLVFWCSEGMLVVYVDLSSKKTEYPIFSIKLWEEYYEKNK